MKFYEGAISYWDIEEMAIPRLLELQQQAAYINKQVEKGAKSGL